MAQFFIHRPIFAWVIALVIMLAGILTLTKMPIAQYPTIAPPTVTIAATYPGASAETVENTVTPVSYTHLTLPTICSAALSEVPLSVTKNSSV